MNSPILFFVIIVFLTACGDYNSKDIVVDGDLSISPELSPAEEVISNTASLILKGLSQQKGQHFEAYLIVNGTAKSIGRFNLNDKGEVYSVDANGLSIKLIGENNRARFEFDFDKTDAKRFIITIEENGDLDPKPSVVKFFAGDLVDNIALASIADSAAIGSDFFDVAAGIILATPSNGVATDNQGIWWLTLESGSPAPTLNLPELNPGWLYEGWVVNTLTGEITSTGTFALGNQADSDGKGSGAGPNNTPPLPGQDFINPAKILNDGNHISVVTVEPSPDFDPKPFALKILKGEIPLNAPVRTVIPEVVVQNAGTSPSVIVFID